MSATPTPTATIAADPTQVEAWDRGLARANRIVASVRARGQHTAATAQNVLENQATASREAAAAAARAHAETMGLAAGLAAAGVLHKSQAATAAGVDRMTMYRFVGMR